ncbi:hypothetical protein [Kordia sp.]|uniref:hypothetical protein n=1 Tax=Kordia sp. TaxID=1965332 RepID=UPI003D6BFAE8
MLNKKPLYEILPSKKYSLYLDLLSLSISRYHKSFNNIFDKEHYALVQKLVKENENINSIFSLFENARASWKFHTVHEFFAFMGFDNDIINQIDTVVDKFSTKVELVLNALESKNKASVYYAPEYLQNNKIFIEYLEKLDIQNSKALKKILNSYPL